MRHSSTAGAGVRNHAGFGLCELAVLYHRSDSHALAGESGKAGNNYGYGAERSCREAPVGTREAGAITVAVQYYGTVTQLFSVSRGSFLPPPNVDSAVIQIQLGTPYAEQVADEKHFFRMVRSGFSQRRKTLVNALSATMGYEKAVVSKALTDCGLSETVRMESLSMEQLIALHRALLET